MGRESPGRGDCGPCPPPPPTGPIGGIITVLPETPDEAENCTEDWSCTEWSDCINNLQTRSCMDSNSCNTTENKPPETRACIFSPLKGEYCEQVITPAVSPTGECKEFLSPCDVPEGWTIIADCPPPAGGQGQSGGLVIGADAVIVIILAIIIVIIAGFYWYVSRRRQHGLREQV